ncbi:SMI1/KNR4 family protein [Sporosarcina sp. FSL W7-1349]|uniref:SMI1/KNR4 family protein n=1 Tax=Sporosarcina sp. FSL W7-1349 TaxID=2921561 RepID=UPI0030FB3B1C
MNTIEKKVEQFHIKRQYSTETMKAIRDIEKDLGAALPVDYTDFLLQFSPFTFDEKEAVIYPDSLPTEETPISFHFYSTNNDQHNLMVLYNRYRGRMPEEIIPIAECPGGDQLCIGIANKAGGKIYFWKHDMEKTTVASIHDLWEPLHLLYPSFYDFVMAWEESKEEAFEAPVIEEIKITDKFLARLKKND